MKLSDIFFVAAIISQPGISGAADISMGGTIIPSIRIRVVILPLEATTRLPRLRYEAL